MNAMTVQNLTPNSSASRRTLATRLAAAAGVVLLGAATLGEARADNVYWSIGVHSPGVNVGVSNAPPVVVYHAPRRYYPQPQVIVLPPQVVYGVPYGHRGPPGWAKHGQKHGNKHSQKHGHKHWKNSDRDDDYGYRQGGYRGDYRGDHRGDDYAWDRRSRDGYRR